MKAVGEQASLATEAVYVASHIKRRRSTRAEVERRREDLFDNRCHYEAVAGLVGMIQQAIP